MNDTKLMTQVARLITLYQESSRTPFPYAGIRKIVQKAEGAYDTLIPDLDLYFSTIAGYCSWGQGVLSWDDRKVEEAKRYASQSFFDRHREYKSLLPLITEADLIHQLEIYEKMRVTLLELMSSLQVQRTTSRE